MWLCDRDGKVRKSVERIFSIWEERSVYPEEVIAQFKAGLYRKEKERERPKEKDKEKEKEKEKVAQPGNGMFFSLCFSVVVVMKCIIIFHFPFFFSCLMCKFYI